MNKNKKLKGGAIEPALFLPHKK